MYNKALVTLAAIRACSAAAVIVSPAASDNSKDGHEDGSKPADIKLLGDRWMNNIIPVRFTDLDPMVGNLTDDQLAVTTVTANIEQRSCIRFYPFSSGDSKSLKISYKASKCDTTATRAPSGNDKEVEILVSQGCAIEDLYQNFRKVLGFTKPAKGPFTPADWSAINAYYNCDDASLNPPHQRLPSECYTAPPSVDPEHSTYQFSLDPSTVKYAQQLNKGFIGVRQQCVGKNAANKARTENWGYTELSVSQFYINSNITYAVTLPRCKKEHSREADFYEAHLCAAADQSSCVKCVSRDLCNKPDDGQVVKAVSVIDDMKFICHDRFMMEQKPAN